MIALQKATGLICVEFLIRLLPFYTPLTNSSDWLVTLGNRAVVFLDSLRSMVVLSTDPRWAVDLLNLQGVRRLFFVKTSCVE